MRNDYSVDGIDLVSLFIFEKNLFLLLIVLLDQQNKIADLLNFFYNMMFFSFEKQNRISKTEERAEIFKFIFWRNADNFWETTFLLRKTITIPGRTKVTLLMAEDIGLNNVSSFSSTSFTKRKKTQV